jgi:hypothetical protein
VSRRGPQRALEARSLAKTRAHYGETVDSTLERGKKKNGETVEISISAQLVFEAALCLPLLLFNE